MFRSLKKKALFLLASTFLILPSTSAFAQEVPSDYQNVLKSLDKKGDFKAGVLKVTFHGTISRSASKASRPQRLSVSEAGLPSQRPRMVRM